MLSRVNKVAQSVGLSRNAGKAKVFSSCFPDLEKAPLGINGFQLEEVDSFKYIGVRLLPTGQSKDDIVSRIDAAHWVFSSLRKCLWIRPDLSIAIEIRVYRASVRSVRSVLLYGCECWALRVEDERKLEVFDCHCLKTILRVKFTDIVSNETVRVRCDNIARITQAIQERRLKCFGHVLRRPLQELSVTTLDPAPLPHWRRRRGDVWSSQDVTTSAPLAQPPPPPPSHQQQPQAPNSASRQHNHHQGDEQCTDQGQPAASCSSTQPPSAGSGTSSSPSSSSSAFRNFPCEPFNQPISEYSSLSQPYACLPSSDLP
nr:unnamed protein product [Spirometra erinaceieuropaei]